MESIQVKHCAVYARLSETDDTVTTQEERDALYVKRAKDLGCEAVQIYEDRDIKGCCDCFLELLDACRRGEYDAVILFDLTVGFARWRDAERRLTECGAAFFEARAGNAFVQNKERRRREHLRQKREKEWQDWVDFNTQPVRFEPDDE